MSKTLAKGFVLIYFFLHIKYQFNLVAFLSNIYIFWLLVDLKILICRVQGIQVFYRLQGKFFSFLFVFFFFQIITMICNNIRVNFGIDYYNKKCDFVLLSWDFREI